MKRYVVDDPCPMCGLKLLKQHNGVICARNHFEHYALDLLRSRPPTMEWFEEIYTKVFLSDCFLVYCNDRDSMEVYFYDRDDLFTALRFPPLPIENEEEMRKKLNVLLAFDAL